MNAQTLLELLKTYGISSERELDCALKNMGLDVSIFVRREDEK